MKTAQIALLASLLSTALPSGALTAQSGDELSDRIQRIMDRPEFRHSHFGIEFFSLDSGRPIYQHNSDKLFTPGSTTKLVTAGAVLHLLGADYRFRTRVYRTGPIRDGILDGDVVLVASGDPNLSARVREDGTLAFEDNDHAYGGPAVPGDPLLVIRKLARQIASHGITRILGAVRVDISLFPEGDRELGSGVVISPIVVNDNLIDGIVSPGPTVGAPVEITRTPITAYAHFINQATTGPSDSRSSIRISSDVEREDGTRVVTIAGSVPAGSEPTPMPYRVPVPSRYAEVVLAEALRDEGVSVDIVGSREAIDFAAMAAHYTDAMMVAEHVSLPLREEVKVILKVSQNLHASMAPLYLRAILSPDDEERTGFDEIHDFLSDAGLDLNGAQQGDGAGGDAHFSPGFMVSYLAHLAKQEAFEHFRSALPILGQDGTLWNIQPDSPAVGNVFAKTGTYVVRDPLNRRWFLTAKGLAGYMTTARGENLAFALYINNVPLPDLDAITPVVGQAIGEIAAAAWDAQW